MKKPSAFTLVEILVVVVVLAILAMMIVPQIGKSVDAARTSSLAQDLRVLRTHILLYKSQHLETAPGYPNGDETQVPTEEELVKQTTLASTIHGQTAPRGTPGFPFGPYLLNIPKNPYNDKSSVQMLANDEAFPAGTDNSHGWVYKAATAQIRADNTGTDEGGVRYYDY